MNYIELVTNEIMFLNQRYIETSTDNYNFWEQHVKYVVKEAKELAKKYGADIEIVELGALLHDVALMSNVGERKDHHINGANIARDILNKVKYPEERIEKIIGCVLNHRSSKNATNIEEQCVADADILAHFDNLSMLYWISMGKRRLNCDDAKKFVKNKLEFDYKKLYNFWNK